MWTTKQFFEEAFSQKISRDPLFMAECGLRNQSLAVEIEGNSGGSWLLHFDGEGRVDLVVGQGEAHCTVQTNEKTFEGMLTGSVNIPWAFMMRKIKVKGETALAIKLGLALQKAFK